MSLARHLTLRQLLTLPYIALVLALAATIGALSWHVGREAVDTLSAQRIGETAARVAQAVDRQLVGADAALEAAFPLGIAAPDDLAAALPLLRQRFWIAASVHRDPNHYVYYGDVEGRFIGLWRDAPAPGQADTVQAELRLRLDGNGARRIARFAGIDGRLADPVAESRVFEPRERPWFITGMASAQPAWSPVYIDFRTNGLVTTRVRRVAGADGRARGVVATDVALDAIDRFLRGLALDAGGVALVVEPDGTLIAASRGRALARGADGQPRRLAAGDSDDLLVAATWAAYGRLRERGRGAAMAANQPMAAASSTTFTGHDGRLVQMAQVELAGASGGPGWRVLVAVPRNDLLAQTVATLRHSLALGALAAVAALLIGLAVLQVVARELGALALMAQRIGEGQPCEPVTRTRRDELGALARSLVALQQRLLTDRLTGLSNREAVTRRIDERLARHRRRGDAAPFALLFIDVNRFKQINDRHGHARGDAVLREIGERLQQRVRAGDTVARWAGDEFVVLLDDVRRRDDAEQVRLQLEAALSEPLLALADAAAESTGSLAGLVPPVGLPASPAGAGAAIGLAIYPEDGVDVATLVATADHDMYRRKQRRRAA